MRRDFDNIGTEEMLDEACSRLPEKFTGNEKPLKDWTDEELLWAIVDRFQNKLTDDWNYMVEMDTLT